MTQVSYIVTVDNQLPYLEAMLASLRAQEGDHSREFVFVDDGSEDGSFDALIQRTRLWPRTLLIQQRRQGPTAAALAGAKAATGDTWLFLDADVVLNPAATRLGYDALKSGAADMILFPHAIAPAPLSYDFAMPPSGPAVRVAEDPLLALLTEFPAPHRRMMMRRAVFRDPGLFDPAVYLPDVAPPLNAALTHKVGILDLALSAGRADAPSAQRRGGGQAEHDRSLAVAHFVIARPELPRRLRKAALRIAARRSWEAARKARAGLTSRFFWLYAKTLCGWPMDVPTALKECLAAWDAAAVRRPPPPKG